MVQLSESIALAERTALSMDHVKRMLKAAECLREDMQGGKGYRDAMRQYT